MTHDEMDFALLIGGIASIFAFALGLALGLSLRRRKRNEVIALEEGVVRIDTGFQERERDRGWEPPNG